jgi:DNA-binding Lrp family transcriptional regulator
MLQLTQREREVLSVCGLQADLPVAQIALKLRCSENTVRNTIRSLLERRVIEPRNYLDVFQLGLNSYVMLFSLRSDQGHLRTPIISKLASLPGVVWFAEIGGEFEYVMNICQGNVHRLAHFLDQIGDEFGDVFSKKVLVQHSSYRDYSYGFLTDRRFDSDFVGTSPHRSNGLLDETDHLILREIAEHPSSMRSISKRIGLPMSTIQYRLERLKKAGIWIRTIFLINHSALGYSFALILLHTSSSTRALREDLHRFSLGHPNIITLTESIGTWDFELSALAHSPEDLRKLTDSISDRFPGRFSVISYIPLYRLIKWNQYPFRSYEDYLESVAFDWRHSNDLKSQTSLKVCANAR